MSALETQSYTGFHGHQLFAAGDLPEVALKAKTLLEQDANAPVAIYDNATGRIVDIDYRGTAEDVIARIAARSKDGAPKPKAGPGRPKLGVVSREVTLLPRHWDWLRAQPGGASVALRKLVEAARRDNVDIDKSRLALEAVYRFMSTVAGDFPGFEEACRAFFAKDYETFDDMISLWPDDIQDHIRHQTENALQMQKKAEAQQD
ncbi:DUF2239 family protein [Hahella sp. KA22]|uniref:DUF2239 family protein n=1 Tax=Hahella sp. KA22 TaxID=1628392 RepID=UPI000FDE6441|nr:DUF2239 family protein [Hahella sp. KA22]AZZ94460.1 DUF2239 family protein [Hahella sp. KA22]QAY57833.1 DUF2239 family protein [Hahella sp. KA22]